MKLVETIFNKPKSVEDKNSNKLSSGILLRCVYPICNVGELNANNRIYEREVWEKVLNDPDIKEKIKNRNLWGQAEHPEETQSDLQLTSHVITKLWIDEKVNKIFQEVEVLDTPSGRIIEALFKANCPPGVSTRAEGDLEDAEIEESDGSKKKVQKVIPESYKFVTVDFTADPSTQGTSPQKVEMNVVETITGLVKDGKMNLNEKKFATKILNSIKCKECKCGKDCKVQALVDEMEEKKIETAKAEQEFPKGSVYPCRSCGKKFDDPKDVNTQHHCKKCALALREFKIQEGVQELIGEVPGIDKEDQEILNWAIENKVISDQFPSEEEIIDALAVNDIDTGEDLEGDPKVIYLKYILLPKAKQEHEKQDVDITAGKEKYLVTFDDGEEEVFYTASLDRAWQMAQVENPDNKVIGVKLIREKVQEDIRQSQPGEYVVTFYDGGNMKVEADSKVDAMKKTREKYPEKRVANAVLQKSTGHTKDVHFKYEESKTNEDINLYKTISGSRTGIPEHEIKRDGERYIDSKTGEDVILDKEASGSAKESTNEAKVSEDEVKKLFKSIDPAFAKHLTGMYEDRISIVDAGMEAGLEPSDYGKQISGEPEEEVMDESVIDEMKYLKNAGVYIGLIEKQDKYNVKYAVVLKGQGPERILTKYDDKNEATTKGKEYAGKWDLEFKDLTETKLIKETRWVFNAKNINKPLDDISKDKNALLVVMNRAQEEDFLEIENAAGELGLYKLNSERDWIPVEGKVNRSGWESKNIDDISKHIIDLKVSEASVRADLEVSLNELSKSGSILAENEILQTKLNATIQSLSERHSEFDSLRAVIEKKAQEISDLNKKIDESKITEDSLQARHIAHQEELTKAANEAIIDGRNQVVKEYFDFQLKEHRLQVDENTRALLEDYQNLQDVDNLLEKLTEIARRGALHSKPLTEVRIQRDVTVDPEQNKVDASVGHLMKRFSR